MKTLKNLLLVAALSAPFVLTSCDKAKEKLKVDANFELKLPSVKLYVDTFSTFGDLNLASSVIQSTLQKTLDDNNAKLEDLESVKLSNVEIEMINPGTQNFNIYNKMFGRMSASGVAETRVAYLDPVPTNVTKIILSSDHADLKDYLKQPEINFSLVGQSNAANLERDTVNVTLHFDIVAKVTP